MFFLQPLLGSLIIFPAFCIGDETTAVAVLSTTNRWISGHAEDTDWGKVQAAVKVAKAMSAYIPQAGPIISAVFGVAEIIIDGHVPDEVGEKLKELSSELDSLKKEITEGVKKVTEVCKGLNYNKIATKAGALSLTLKEIIDHIVKKQHVNMEPFLTECKRTSIMLMIYSIPELIESPKSHILKSPLIMDPLHQFATINQTRTELFKTVNTLLFMELFCIKFKTNRNFKKREIEPVVRSVIHVNALIERYVETYKNEAYFEKMKDIVANVIQRIGKRNEKETATELLKTLKDIHTSDRFVVVVGGTCNLPNLFSGIQVQKLLFNECVRERFMGTGSKRCVCSHMQRCKLSGNTNFTDILLAVPQSGLAVYSNPRCQMAIVYDEESVIMKKPFQSDKKLTCMTNPTVGTGPTSREIKPFTGQIFVFPV